MPSAEKIFERTNGLEPNGEKCDKISTFIPNSSFLIPNYYHYVTVKNRISVKCAH